MIQCITKFLEEVGTVLPYQIFRGQSDSTWPLHPSIARQRDLFDQGQWTFTSWRQTEDTLIEQFQRLGAPHIDKAPENQLEWLVLMQHYGLPTVLLDWSTNPLKALFFAVEDLRYEDTDAAVYSYLPKSWYENTDHGISVSSPTCFFPKHQNQRLINQEGCFLIFPLPEGFEAFLAMDSFASTRSDIDKMPIRIIIPAKLKNPIRKQLDMLGITHQTMYPGLDGISKTIRRRAGLS